jgi:hypothetical protein
MMLSRTGVYNIHTPRRHESGTHLRYALVRAGRTAANLTRCCRRKLSSEGPDPYPVRPVGLECRGDDVAVVESDLTQQPQGPRP